MFSTVCLRGNFFSLSLNKRRSYDAIVLVVIYHSNVKCSPNSTSYWSVIINLNLTGLPFILQYCLHQDDKKQFDSQIFSYDGCWGEKFTFQDLLSIITQMGPAKDCKGKLTRSHQFPRLQSVWFVCCLFRTLFFFSLCWQPTICCRANLDLIYLPLSVFTRLSGL